MTVDTTLPSVFDAGLPTLSYDLSATPGQVWSQFQDAQRKAPIAIGPLGPEVLSYDFARALLRDTRFTTPPGINLVAQGVTSGPLYEKVMH
ncbi:MAG: cytochrome P450, partial [Mycobacterium sp.]|nr:cytochrome P450 [Mycobacterium sp.]